ncbi:MAG: hypothetical protein RL329_4016 [Bacteroidota bacterium]
MLAISFMEKRFQVIFRLAVFLNNKKKNVEKKDTIQIRSSEN